MKLCKSLLFAVVVLGVSVSAMADPTIGVYFDENATVTNYTAELGSIETAYVLITNADMLLGGAAFKLDSEGGFNMLPAVWTDGLLLGNLVDGAEIGLYSPIPQFGMDAAVICSFQYYSFSTVLNSHLSIVAHPNYDTPKVANSAAIMQDAVGISSTLNIRATPEIGVFFDEAATLTTAIKNGGFTEIHNAWIMIRGAEMVVGGAAFKLTLDPRIFLLNATYANGLNLGTVTTGVEMGLYNNVPVFGADAALLVSLELTTFVNLMTDAELVIGAHPNYDTVKVADSNAIMWNADGLTSLLTIPVGTENMAWGSVKSLY